MNIYNIYFTLLAYFLSTPFAKNIYLMPKGENVNIHLLIKLEHLRENKEKNHSDFHEIRLANDKILLKEQQMDKSIKILKNKHNLKITSDLKDKIILKIADENGKPFYLRKLDTSRSNEIFINISNWSKGSYNVNLSDLSGTILSSGKFNINRINGDYKNISPTDLAYLQFL